jgi:hypothetical protein
MAMIHHKDRPVLEFPDEPWRSILRSLVKGTSLNFQPRRSKSVLMTQSEGKVECPFSRNEVRQRVAPPVSRCGAGPNKNRDEAKSHKDDGMPIVDSGSTFGKTASA